jgi:hypothetical protein
MIFSSPNQIPLYRHRISRIICHDHLILDIVEENLRHLPKKPKNPEKLPQNHLPKQTAATAPTFQ